jgi:predicted pyridoxine 5'-phosphate oxidase superfamily flavin-nucleotide-binding protein
MHESSIANFNEVRERARRSVLCWLATVDDEGQPNVSPKEVWAIIDDRHVVVANIASPQTARNIALNPKVCLSFVDVLVQKGYKLVGHARAVSPHESEFLQWAQPLLDMVQGRFHIHHIWVIEVNAVQAIVAPSYWVYPDITTEASQVAAAWQTYSALK